MFTQIACLVRVSQNKVTGLGATANSLKTLYVAYCVMLLQNHVKGKFLDNAFYEYWTVEDHMA